MAAAVVMWILEDLVHLENTKFEVIMTLFRS